VVRLDRIGRLEGSNPGDDQSTVGSPLTLSECALLPPVSIVAPTAGAISVRNTRALDGGPDHTSTAAAPAAATTTTAVSITATQMTGVIEPVVSNPPAEARPSERAAVPRVQLVAQVLPETTGELMLAPGTWHLSAPGVAPAWVVVGTHPLITLTDADGAFAFASVPPGTYTLSAWQPPVPPNQHGRMQTQRVVVTAGDISFVDLRLRAER
jgi:hypothetical protein